MKEREYGLDRVKAVAILCVVAIHSLRLWGRTDIIGRLTPPLTEWAVPAFFFAAGYVRSRTEPYPPGQVRRWLVRLLPTYLIASILAWLTRGFVMNETIGFDVVVSDFLTGTAWGIYYFVPLLLGALFFSLPLARYPRCVPLICAGLVVALVMTRVHQGYDPLGRYFGLHGIARSPFFWWGYFVAGWLVKQSVTERFPRRWIFGVAATAAAIGTLVVLAHVSEPARAISKVVCGLTVPTALLFASRRPVSWLVSILSTYSYEIYLFHFFVVAIAHQHAPGPPGLGAGFAIWAAAIGSSLAIGISVSRVLEPLQSRYGMSPQARPG